MHRRDRDYTLQMRMIAYLHSVYPRGHVTLHAGELVPGLVEPADLTFHIRQAVEMRAPSGSGTASALQAKRVISSCFGRWRAGMCSSKHL